MRLTDQTFPHPSTKTGWYLQQLLNIIVTPTLLCLRKHLPCRHMPDHARNAVLHCGSGLGLPLHPVLEKVHVHRPCSLWNTETLRRYPDEL